MDLYAELVSLTAGLDRAGVEYALCGGLAVAFYGYPRFTKDIDFLVREEDIRRIKEIVSDLGFIAPAIPMNFNVGTEGQCTVHRISKIVDEEVLTLDLLVPGPGLQHVWKDKVQFPWDSGTITVVSRKGLIAMKRLANRDQDRLDLKNLEACGD